MLLCGFPAYLSLVFRSVNRFCSCRVWCRNYRYGFTYTRNTPFANSRLSPGELLLIFILYADTLLSINQIAQLFETCYDTVHTQLREREAAFECGFPSSGHVSNTPSRVQFRSMKPARSARATRDNRRRGTASPAAALGILAGHGGRTLTATNSPIPPFTARGRLPVVRDVSASFHGAGTDCSG